MSHHVTKHQTRWTVRQIPDTQASPSTGNTATTASTGGVLEWTSPTGRQHRTYPERSATTVHSPPPSPRLPSPEPDDPEHGDPYPPPF
ncbi:hypothetical protein GCM10009809_08340 [Isoptericola hypogeus]|uniref:Uncharacterized protein n=1 Tax=Isoptericola hypogeus TaxID=300179 RepID=A0ABN2IYX6_9MICO